MASTSTTCQFIRTQPQRSTTSSGQPTFPQVRARIEGPEVRLPFYLASMPGWLHLRISELEPVRDLLRLAQHGDTVAPIVAERAVELFERPVEPGHRSEYEAPICCYAYVLSQFDHPAARAALALLDARVGAEYGWLDRLLGILRDPQEPVRVPDQHGNSAEAGLFPLDFSASTLL